MFERMSDVNLAAWWRQYGMGSQAPYYRDVPRRAARAALLRRGLAAPERHESPPTAAQVAWRLHCDRAAAAGADPHEMPMSALARAVWQRHRATGAWGAQAPAVAKEAAKEVTPAP